MSARDVRASSSLSASLSSLPPRLIRAVDIPTAHRLSLVASDDGTWTAIVSPCSVRSGRNLQAAAFVHSLRCCPARPTLSTRVSRPTRPITLPCLSSFISTMTTSTAAPSSSSNNDSTTSTVAAAAAASSTSPAARVVSLLHTYSLTGYIVPTADAHQSEYVADCDNRRAYISGFTGSAGTALLLSPAVSPSHKLWTDGRYFLQATQQLSSDWELMRMRQPGVPELEEFIAQSLPEGSKVGVDPSTMSITGYKSLSEQCKPKGIEIVTHTANLIDEAWASHRPPLPNNPIIVHGEPWAGRVRSSQAHQGTSRAEEEQVSRAGSEHVR